MNLNPWLIGSLLLLLTWLLFWIFNSRMRKRMVLASVLLMPTGISQGHFVPEYWNPPSIFKLSESIGFDLESLLFSFSIGGISIALFELFSSKRVNQLRRNRNDQVLIIIAACTSVVFCTVYDFLGFNPIYSLLAALYSGSVFLMMARPVIIPEAIKHSLVFLFFYTIVFLMLNIIFPDFVSETWNLSNISNILIMGIPIEEFAYAFGFAMMWSMVYRIELVFHRSK